LIEGFFPGILIAPDSSHLSNHLVVENLIYPTRNILTKGHPTLSDLLIEAMLRRPKNIIVVGNNPANRFAQHRDVFSFPFQEGMKPKNAVSCKEADFFSSFWRKILELGD
jgi:hypothetical protein